nr:IS3 family transposase [Nonomuraea typhae]
MTLAKFELIEAEKANHRITAMCRWLQVSRSGYHEWRERPASATAQRREHLAALIEQIFADSHETYGYRRIHAALARRGEVCSAELVRALMREHALTPVQVRAFRPITTEQGDFRSIPDLVRRDFTADRPGIKLVGDVTYIRTWEGFLYLATVIDCHSKAVLGWAMADHYRTELITDALRMAVGTGLIPTDAVFHTDRGSNGGFNRSSQHPDFGGVDGSASWMDAGVDGAVTNEVAGRADDIAAVAATLNARPRKSLGWRTPAEAFNDHLESLLSSSVATTP